MKFCCKMISSARCCLRRPVSGILASSHGPCDTNNQQTRGFAKKLDDSSCCTDKPQSEGRQVVEWPGSSDHTYPRVSCNGPMGPHPLNNDPYRIKVPDVAVPPLPPTNAKPMLSCAKIIGPCAPRIAPEPPPCPKPPKKKIPWFYPTVIIGSFMTFVGLLYKYYLYLEDTEAKADKPVWQPRRIDRRPMHEEDLPPCVQYLLIGAGAAAWGAYKAILTHDDTAKVFFITREDCFPYDRTVLSKEVWWRGYNPDITSMSYVRDGLKKTMYYQDCRNYLDIVKFYRRKKGPATAVAMGWCVNRIDADEHIAWVSTNCGERPIYYERCLIALGLKPKNLSIFTRAPRFVRDRVTTFRTFRDLELAYRRVFEAKHVTIIGGGPLGVELAWFMGRIPTEEPPTRPEDFQYPKITHVYKDKGILSGIIPDYLGEWAAEKLKCEHVNIVPKAQVYDAFEREDGRLELTLSNGQSIVTDFAIIAIGSTPREELAHKSFLELDALNGGYKVDTELEARTHLYVAGDVASVYSQWKNYRVRVEHVNNADAQGYAAGMNMTGYWTPYNMEPHYWINLGHDLNVEVVGEVGACMPIVGLFKPCDKQVEAMAERELEKFGEKDFNRPCYKDTMEYKYRYQHGMLFYLRDDTVVGIVFWNFPPIEDRMEVATELLRARPTYQDINLLAELLGFPTTECVPYEDKVAKRGTCISEDASRWLPYSEKEHMLSKNIEPEVVTEAKKDAEVVLRIE